MMKKANRNVNEIIRDMDTETLQTSYLENNIIYERCELYNDFIKSLIELIFDTYLGDDIMTDTDKSNHYNWCWNTTVARFKEEGIIIGNKGVYTYFYEFMFDVYYNSSSKSTSKVINQNIMKLWEYLFNVNNKKNKLDLETFLEIYHLFDYNVDIVK